ncbi:Hem25p [Sporobolomyces salmoneus]|uniref:Hem25p n=1 Tax=Sporobolomyces salmoneus TaxID=183962 RepID=UPI003179F189
MTTSASATLPLPLDRPTPAPSTSSSSLPASWHLASGAISGAASVLMLQPLDLIKTRIQQPDTQIPSTSTSASSSSNSAPSSSKTAPTGARRALPPSIWSTTKQVVSSDGLRGLWRGTTPTLYRNVPGVSMYFLTLSKLRTVVGNIQFFKASTIPGATATGGKVKLTTTGDLLVGSTARTGVGFLLMPFTLMKTISESTLSLPSASASTSTIRTPSSLSSSSRPTTLGSIRTLYQSGGLKSLWRGAVPTALRDAPGAGLFIVFYERGRRILGVTGDKGGGAVGGGTAGAAASLCSTLLTTPFDLLKTRRQLSPTIYTTLFESIKLVYRQNGLRGFWEGGGLRVVRKAGSAGIGWAVYEAFLGVGERRRDGKERSGGG